MWSNDANIPKHNLHLLYYTWNSPFYVAKHKLYATNKPEICLVFAPQMHRKHLRFALKKRRKHTRLTPQTRPKDIAKASVLRRESVMIC